jgi:Ca2+-binding RTX toxin-like protein
LFVSTFSASFIEGDEIAGVYKLLGAADASAPTAAAVSLDGAGVLSVVGTDQADTINVDDVYEANSTVGEDDPPTGDIIAAVAGKLGRIYKLSDVHLVSVLGGAGNDTIEISTSSPNATVSGGDGNDTITAGEESDSLSGNAGRDYINGGGGNDRVAGNGGRDKLFSGDGDDRILGGAGGDWLFGDAGHDTLIGGDGNDILEASYDGGSVLHGNAGNDLLITRSFDDTYPPDHAFGDFGQDTVLAGDTDVLLSIESINPPEPES